ncbi:CU044_5270 family protein [Spirillospora sp. NPDC048911]|uniref:CU044_5270 family protein n=1 Tax=Spirillospora sp. NPDC048911 TaxID=3364527 RepID=UPI003723E575
MTRDVLRVLADARPRELDPEARVDETTRSAELARAMTVPPRSAGRSAEPAVRRRVRPMWGLGLVGAAAAAALVVATTATGPGDPGKPGPKAGGAPSAETEAPVTMNAQTVLLSAAAGADREAFASGAYWHVARTSRGHLQVGKGANRYLIVTTERDEAWTPAKPGGKAWGRQQRLGAKPLTAKDDAAWRRAGSPARFNVEIPVSPKGGMLKPMPVDVAPGRPHTSSSKLVNGDKVFWLGRNVTMKDLQGLPADPKRLKASLLRWYDGHSTESLSEPMKADDWLWQVTKGLITDMPVTPKVRAGAFRMLAQLKTIKAVGPVRDGAGRIGTALILTERTPSNGTLEHRLIIDEKRGRALGYDIVIVKPAGVNANLPAGALLSGSTIDEAGWTDTAPTKADTQRG